MRNVAAEGLALEVHGIHTLVGKLDGLLERVAERRHGNDTATGGDKLAAGVKLGACVVDGDVLGHGADGDGYARRVLARVALAGEHDADGVLVAHHGLDRVEATLDTREHNVGEARLGLVEQLEDGLGLGVAEAHVVFEHLGTVGGEHEADKEHADEGEALVAHAVDGGTSTSLRMRAGRSSTRPSGAGV